MTARIVSSGTGPVRFCVRALAAALLLPLFFVCPPAGAAELEGDRTETESPEDLEDFGPVDLDPAADDASPDAAREGATAESDESPEEEAARRRYDRVEEVVVTAQRREQNLREVPISVTAFSRREIELNQIEGLQDYFRLTPNLSFSNNGNRGRSQVSIRGVGNIGGRSNAFGIYVDGFNIAPSSSIRSFDPYLVDVERIEVLRGPQGTFFGRNTTGGAISITSVKPSPDLEMAGEVEYGSYDLALARGMVNVPIVDEMLFLRTAAYYEHSDGWVQNIGPAGGRSGFNGGGAHAALRWLPTDRLVLDLSARYNRTDQGPNNYVPRVPPPGIGVPDPPWTVNTDFPERSSIEGWIVTLQAAYEFDHLNFTSITGYVDNRYFEQADRDESPAPIAEQRAGNDLRSFSQELRVDSTVFDQIDLVSGLFVAWDELETTGLITAASGPFAGGALLDNVLNEQTVNWAAFADAVWHAHDMLDLTLGARYSGVDYERRDAQQNVIQPLRTAMAERLDNDVSWRAVVTVKWTDDILTYVSATKGFKSGGANGIIPPPNPVTYAPETLLSYEAGAKLRFFDNRLQANMAAFYYDWDDLQVFIPGLGPLDPPIVANAADARSHGVELELTTVPLSGLEMTFGAGYLNARFRDFQDAAGQDLSGEPLPLAPTWTLNSTGQYTHGLPRIGCLPDLDGFVRGEWSYTAETFRDIDGGRVIPAYHVVNLRAGLEADSVRLVFFVENLLNENYFTGIRNSFTGNPARDRVDPNPRLFGGRVTVRY